MINKHKVFLDTKAEKIEYYGEIKEGIPEGWGVLKRDRRFCTDRFIGNWVEGKKEGYFRCEYGIHDMEASYKFYVDNEEVRNFGIPKEDFGDVLDYAYFEIERLRKKITEEGISNDPISIRDKCPKCHIRPKQVVVNCGHAFCAYCISVNKCPICKKEIMFHINLASR